MNRILNRLWIGGVYDWRYADAMKLEGITTVMKLYDDKPNYPSIPEEMVVLRTPAIDGAGWTTEWLTEKVDELHQRWLHGESIIVMCAAGKSRSATIVLAYLCRYRGMSLHEAWGHLKAIRPEVDPHIELIVTLMKFLDVHPYLSTLTGW